MNQLLPIAWLAMFAARRALPCWELYCDRNTPHFAVEAIKNWLYRKSPNSWQPLSEQPLPSYRGKLIEDRYCDTSASAASVAAVSIISRKALIAMSAVSCADGAFDQSALGERDNCLGKYGGRRSHTPIFPLS